MTIRCVSSRGQVTVALMLGVYLIIASRSHFNQMLVDATGKRKNDYTYSAMNVVFQVMYAAVQVPAFVYADRMDPLIMLGIVPLGVGVTSAVAPFVLPRLSSTPWSAAGAVTGALFAVNGALIGSWWPFMNVMLSNWAPPAKLSYMYSIIHTGIPGGIALGNAFTGLVYGIHGSDFRYSFFIVSVICMLWSILWLCMFHSEPAKDPGIHEEELEYLSSNIQPKTKSAVPWKKVVTSLPTWSLMMANFGSTVFYTILIMYMPVYLKNTMKVDISQNGFMSTLPSLGQILVMFLTGSLSSFIHLRGWINVTNIRKIFTFIGLIIPACIILVATFYTNKYIFYGMLVMAYSISGSVFSGFRVSQIEMAPNFVAAITSICDLAGSCAMNLTHVAFIVKFGTITEQTTWNKICWSLSATIAVCTMPYIIFGSSRVQTWNEVSQ